MPAPLGNKNAAKAKKWSAAIERALARKAGAESDGIEATPAMKALDQIADRFVEAAMAGPSYEKGDPWLGIISQLGDRLDGRPAQALEHSGPDGGPIEQKHKLEVGFLNGGG